MSEIQGLEELSDPSEDSRSVRDEDEGRDDFDDQQFHPQNQRCNLDDLEELLKSSEKYKSTLRRIESSDSLFIDDEFTPGLAALRGFFSDDKSRQRVANIEWRRSHEYFPHDVQMFDKMSPEDIHQGRLGDCYFLAAISALAEKQSRLHRLFLTKTLNEHRLVVVALCINGVWEEIILDDFLPCDEHNQPVFNTSKSNELWAMLLEKAWAKVHGGYLNIESGLTREALRDLTGASVTTFFTKNRQKELWEKLVDAEDRGFVMTAGSKDLSGGSDEFIVDIGLSGSHAYSLLSVHALVAEGGSYRLAQGRERLHSKTRLVKLRNPWGRFEWKGKWSDDDPRWTPELEEALQKTDNPEDGIFFIPWRDFLQNFSDLQICYFHDDYKYNAEKFRTGRNESLFLEFELDEAGKHYFSVNQQNKRFFAESRKYKYSSIGWVLARRTFDGLEFVEGRVKADKENWKDVECAPGKYVVMILTPWRSFVRDFSFSIYGPDFVHFSELRDPPTPAQFLSEMFTGLAKKEMATGSSGFEKNGNISFIQGNHRGWGYLYLQNDDPRVHAQLQMKEKSGSPPLRSNLVLVGDRDELKAAPGSSGIVVFRNVSRKVKFDRPIEKISQEQISDSENSEMFTKKKKYKKKSYEIFLTIDYFDNLVTIHIENLTRNVTLKEFIQFDLRNAKIENQDGNELTVNVPYKQEKYIDIKIINPQKQFKVRIKKIKSEYEIIDEL